MTTKTKRPATEDETAEFWHDQEKLYEEAKGRHREDFLLWKLPLVLSSLLIIAVWIAYAYIPQVFGYP